MGDHFVASLDARLSVVDPFTGELITKTDVLEKVHLEVSSKVDEVGWEEHVEVALNGVEIFCEDVATARRGPRPHVSSRVRRSPLRLFTRQDEVKSCVRFAPSARWKVSKWVMLVLMVMYGYLRM